MTLYIYTLNISSFTRYSATTDIRWGENCNKFLFRNSLLYIAVKKLRKSVNICLSYRKNKSVSFFYGPRCRSLGICRRCVKCCL